MISNGQMETLLQIRGESDWLIVGVLVALFALALLWLFQRYRPDVRRRRAEQSDLDRERQERHTTGGPTTDSTGRRWNPRP